MVSNGLLWIGARDREFSEIVRALQRQAQVRFVETPEAANELTADLVILAQRRPGELSSSSVRELRQKFKSIPFLYLLGEWCCGEKRTNDQFGEVPAMYTHEIRQQVSLQQLRRHARQLDEDIDRCSCQRKTFPDGALVAIYAPAKSFQAAISGMLSAVGLKTVQLNFADHVATHGVDFVVWEVADNVEVRWHELNLLQRRHRGARVIGLATFPRESEFRSLEQAGVSVLAQPFRLDTFFERFCDAPVNVAMPAA